MIVKSPVPNYQLTDYLYNKSSQRLIPLSRTFELSPVCNFDCRMCYVRKTPREVRESPRPIMTLEDWRTVAREALNAGTLFLLLTGGEPLLWPHFWTLYEELVDMGFLVAINTNGSMIDEAAVERFRRRPPRRINITLYGAGDESYRRLCGVDGMFSKVDRGIRMLTEAGILVKLNCSLTPQNAADLEAITAYARDRQLLLSVATYMFPPIRRDPNRIGENERFTPEETARYRLRSYELQCSREEYLTYLQHLRDGYVDPPGLEEGCVDPVDGKIRCRAGKATFWITWDGWMTACGMMPEPRVELRGRPFAESWGELTRASAECRLSGVCDKCPNVRVCHPCAAMAVAETGSYSGIPRFLCEVTQECRRIAAQTLAGQ